MVQEIIEVASRELVAHQAAPTTLYGTNDPQQILEHATAQANALAKVIEQKHLYADIRGRKHVLLEGWTTLGSLVGVFAVPVWTHPIKDEAGAVLGWEARVEARTMGGAIVGAAEAQCMGDEELGRGMKWGDRDDYALRSMAQTRASSKALRLPLGFIMTLAGFDATPADEMPRGEPAPRPQQAPQQRQAAPNQMQGTGQARPPAQSRGSDAPRPVSDAQKGAIHKLLAALKGKNPQMHDRVIAGLAIAHPDAISDDGGDSTLVLTALNSKQASEFMDVIGAAMRGDDAPPPEDPDDLPFE